ncbi:hypothetical protein JW960_09425, partial [candidate division KSB1 bacterium]|nr:hypothetical protein [candidate division KSB1 bacterium]
LDVNAVSFYLLMSTSAHHRFKPTLVVGLNTIREIPVCSKGASAYGMICPTKTVGQARNDRLTVK